MSAISNIRTLQVPSTQRAKGQDEDQYVRVGDVRVRYRKSGSGGPALILIHGLGASLEVWDHNLGPLGEHFRVFAPDLVWFGKSDKPSRQVTGDYFAEFVTGFMDSIGVKRAVLVGNSMGGMIVTKTALARPERVSGLVLVNSAGFGRELTWWLRLRTLLKPSGKARKTSRRLARWAAGWIVHDARSVTDDYIDLTIELNSLPENIEAYTRVLCYGVDWRGVKPTLVNEMRGGARGISVPTLIVWGKQDRVVPVKHAEIARACIPQSQVHIFDRCGHAPMLEKAHEFNALMTRFVREEIVR